MKNTQAQNEAIIRDAISRSISHSEVVRVTIDGGDIQELVSAAILGEWECLTENDGSLDVYSVNSDDAWRINVTIEATPEAGDRVEGGDPDTDDYDTGRVDAIDGDNATVAWDSGVTTTQPIKILRVIS